MLQKCATLFPSVTVDDLLLMIRCISCLHGHFSCYVSLFVELLSLISFNAVHFLYSTSLFTKSNGSRPQFAVNEYSSQSLVIHVATRILVHRWLIHSTVWLIHSTVVFFSVPVLMSTINFTVLLPEHIYNYKGLVLQRPANREGHSMKHKSPNQESKSLFMLYVTFYLEKTGKKGSWNEWRYELLREGGGRMQSYI